MSQTIALINLKGGDEQLYDADEYTETDAQDIIDE